MTKEQLHKYVSESTRNESNIVSAHCSPVVTGLYFCPKIVLGRMNLAVTCVTVAL